MGNAFQKVILTFILIVLIILTFNLKSLNNTQETKNTSVTDIVLTIDKNRFAIINVNKSSGNNGVILIMEYKEDTGQLEYITSTNYKDFFKTHITKRDNS